MFGKEEILKKIQENKFLKNLDKNTIIFFIEKHFKKITHKKEFEKITKDIKKNLNDIYKQFLTNKYNKKEKLLEKKEFLKILKVHKSTKERFENYKKIYKKIFENYKPKKIADLGCGLNPISYLILKKILKKNIKFFSTDISKKDCDFLNKFFKKAKIQGSAKSYNLLENKIFKERELKNCDTFFLFKVLDSLEKYEKNISKKIILKLKTKKLVISFPTKSLKKKDNFKIKRTWFKNFLKEEKLQFKTFEIEDEIFFLINL